MTLADPPRLWCLPASESDEVLVLARFSAASRASIGQRTLEGPWTLVARWNPRNKGAAGLEHGAWTRLRLISHRCRVDSKAEFWLYHAKDRGGPWNAPDQGPFMATNAGGTAVARAPWVSALAFTALPSIHHHFALPLDTPHVLSIDEQRRLVARFPAVSKQVHWFLEQQPGWEPLKEPVPGLPDSGETDAFVQRGAKGCDLVALIPREKYSPTRPRSFCLLTPNGVSPLSDVAWCRLLPGGRLLQATTDGHLQVCNIDDATGSITVRDGHDLSVLTPSPSPPPARALRGL